MSTNESATASTADVNVEVARREYRLLKRLTLLALAIACAIPLSINLVDPDLWGHVRYGQDWLAEGTLPRTASHTFTAVDYPWINHENLAELAFAKGFAWFGAEGLLLVKCALGMSILLSMAWVARRRQVHSFTIWPLLLLVAANLQAFFIIRPQLLSFALCSVVLIVLDRAFERWQTEQTVRWPVLWWLPAVFLVWTNSHGGFALGLCVVGAYLAGRIVETTVRKRRRAWPQVVGLGVLGLSCLAVSFVNPYGWELHRWMAMSLGQPRPEITEWAPPKVSDPIFWQWITLLLVTSISVLATQRRRDWVQIIILGLVAWQSAMHLRHIAFLALLCGFWLPPYLQSALARLRPSRDLELPTVTLPFWLRKTAVVVLLLAIGLQSFVLDDLWSNLPVQRKRYPVDALQFMADHGLEGKLVVSFHWAQYALAALAPETLVAFDGRFRTCYPQEVVDMHFDFLIGEFNGQRSRSPDSGPVDGTRVLKHGSPDLVLIDRRYAHSVEVMRSESQKKDPAWVLLYQDPVAELWGHSDRFNDPTHSDYLPLTARVFDRSPRVGAIQWPALPIRNKPTSRLAGTFAEPKIDAEL